MTEDLSLHEKRLLPQLDYFGLNRKYDREIVLLQYVVFVYK